MVKDSQTNRFCRCIKHVRNTIKPRKGQSKESGAIAVCVTSVLQRTRGRTLKRFHCKTRKGKKGRVITQPALQQGGGRRKYVVELANSIETISKHPEMDISVKVFDNRTKEHIILKKGDQLKIPSLEAFNNNSDDDPYTYDTATFRMRTFRDKKTGEKYKLYIVTGLIFIDRLGFKNKLTSDRFDQFSREFTLTSLGDMFMSSSKSKSRSSSKSHSSKSL